MYNHPYKDLGPTADQSGEAIKIITRRCKVINSLSNIYKDIR